MRALDIIAVVAGFASLIALPFSLYYWSTYKSLKSVLFFAIPFVIAWCACDTLQEIARAQILDQLDSLKADYHFSINGKTAMKPEQILAALKTLDFLPAHHSSPTKRINVEISDHSRIVLWLARDSGNPREYWVFYPNYYTTARNEIGRIITPLFDEY
jgi:hypothetical protein